MSRPVSSAHSTALAETVTRPLYLVELGFSSTLRISSRETLTYLSVSWTAASFRMSMPSSGNWSVDIFNEALSLGASVLSQGTAGKTAKVYHLTGAGPFADDDGELLLDGEMGEATIAGDRVQIALKKRPPLRTPRLLVAPPVFNHLPVSGTVIRTAAGETVLEPKSSNKAYSGIRRR